METYLVFARAAYADPLSFQGTLETPAGTTPTQLALDAHGRHWVELVLIPQSEIHWAIPEESARVMEARP